MSSAKGQLLLGFDVGSSAVKAVLVDPARGIVASQSVPVALYSDHPGWAEAEPSEWWRAVIELVHLVVAEANVSARDVGAVAVSGMVPALVVSDASGRPLRRAMLQNDARATREIIELRRALEGFALLERAGSVVSQQSISPSAMWLNRHEPATWHATVSIQGSYDWVARQLGATPHVERNWAIESGLYALDGAVLAEVIEATTVSWPALLAPRDPGDVVGEVTAAAAEATGLRAGTAIVVGGADHVLSAYGAGLVHPGDTLLKLGGAGDILVVSEEPVTDERLYLDRHPLPGTWLPNGCMATSGSLLRWEQALFNGATLDELDRAAAAASPGSLITLPYFLGEKTPLHDPDLRGVMIGMHLGTTRGDIHRSFLEAIAYGFRAHVDVFLDAGLTLGQLFVTNGGSTSRLWRQILSDVLGRDLTSLVRHPGAAYGAAVIAGIGTGRLATWDYVLGSLDVSETVAPTPSNASRYGERYREFLELTAVTAPFSHALARSQS